MNQEITLDAIKAEESLYDWHCKQDEATKKEFMKLAHRILDPELDLDQYYSEERSIYAWYIKQDEAAKKEFTELIEISLNKVMHFNKSTERGFIKMAKQYIIEEEAILEDYIIFYKNE
jgi:hypothetical protein